MWNLYKILKLMLQVFNKNVLYVVITFTYLFLRQTETCITNQYWISTESVYNVSCLILHRFHNIYSFTIFRQPAWLWLLCQVSYTLYSRFFIDHYLLSVTRNISTIFSRNPEAPVSEFRKNTSLVLHA